jgi:hypothetical protein
MEGYHSGDQAAPIFIGDYWMIGRDRGTDWAVTYLLDKKTLFVTQEAMDELLAHMRGQPKEDS